MGLSLAIKVMGKQGLLKAPDPEMLICQPWASSLFEGTLGQLSSCLSKEGGLVSLQG